MTASDRVTAADVVRMQRLAQRVAALRPELANTDATFGELAWMWGKGHVEYGHTWRRRLWFADRSDAASGNGSGDDLVAWAWALLPYQLRRSDGSVQDVEDAFVAFQVHPEHAELVDDAIAWFEGVVPDVDRRVLPRAADHHALQRWAAAGYVPDPASLGEAGAWTRLNARALDDIAAPVLPEGFRFRGAAEVGVAAAAQAHIDAWYPSTYCVQAAHDVSRTASYRPDLHPVVEAPDGTMAATAIMWLDEANRTAEFEPVGTHRDYRRRGLAKAMLLHGMHLAREAGATHMTVACLGRPGNAALGLYESVGFREVTRDAPMVKRKRQTT